MRRGIRSRLASHLMVATVALLFAPNTAGSVDSSSLAIEARGSASDLDPVTPPVRPPDGGGDALAVVTQPIRDIQVLVIKYFPLTPDGQNIDINVTGDVGDPLGVIQAKVNSMTADVTIGLSMGSTYRGYANSSAIPDLSYTIVDTREFHTAVPAIPSTFNPSYPQRADYAAIMASLNICSYVTGQGIDQVWIWAYQGPHQLDISESKMAGPYGDISNSYRLNDMPNCSRTYTVYTYNYGRGTAEAVHNHGHQLEAELAAIDAQLFRDLFEGTTPHPAGVATGRCGSVHNPPNARFEYDWINATSNPSDCLAWSPDGLGTTSPISCRTWGCVDNGDTDNPQRNWILWWMQNLPGNGNTITYQGRQLRDWWDVHFDFDQAMGSCRTLVLPCPTVPPTAYVAAVSAFRNTTSVPLSWSARAGSAAVANYDVRYRRAPWNGGFGSYGTWKSATTATSATFDGSAGYTYCFSARARDSIGSASAWTAETCTSTLLDDRSLSRSVSWTAGTGSVYYKGTYVRSSSVGAKLVRTGVVARRIAIVATTCSTCGKVSVYWGSTLLKTINLYSSTTANRKLFTVATFSSARTGTLAIKVYSAGKEVLIDGLAIGRT